MRESALAPVYPIEHAREAEQGEPIVAPDRRTTDASRLTLPIGWVWVIVLGVVGFAVTEAITLASLRSDVREIRTLLDQQKELTDLKLQNMRLDMEKSELRKALLDRLKPETK